MATSTRGRSSSRTGSRNYSFFGSNWGTSAQSGTSGWGSGSTSKRAKSKRTSSAARGGAGGYKSVNTTCQNKISSYRTLMGQTKGAAGKFPRPTPATLNTFANWINKGAVVQMVSPSQVARWAKATSHNFNPQNPTPNACKNVLCKKFGKSTIKAVCRTATGKFLVATAPTYKGRAFNFPR